MTPFLGSFPARRRSKHGRKRPAFVRLVLSGFCHGRLGVGVVHIGVLGSNIGAYRGFRE